jgi:hypothetical protein
VEAAAPAPGGGADRFVELVASFLLVFFFVAVDAAVREEARDDKGVDAVGPCAGTAAAAAPNAANFTGVEAGRAPEAMEADSSPFDGVAEEVGKFMAEREAKEAKEGNDGDRGISSSSA